MPCLYDPVRSLCVPVWRRQNWSWRYHLWRVHPYRAGPHSVQYVLFVWWNVLWHRVSSIRSLLAGYFGVCARLPVQFPRAWLYAPDNTDSCLHSGIVCFYRSPRWHWSHYLKNSGHAWSWSEDAIRHATSFRAILPLHCLNGLSVHPRSGHRQASAKFVPEQCVCAVRLTILWSVGHIL